MHDFGKTWRELLQPAENWGRFFWHLLENIPPGVLLPFGIAAAFFYTNEKVSKTKKEHPSSSVEGQFFLGGDTFLD